MALATVRSHIRSILMKLGVRSQVEVVTFAYRNGWSMAQDPAPRRKAGSTVTKASHSSENSMPTGLARKAAS
jgi:hypothetical protein